MSDTNHIWKLIHQDADRSGEATISRHVLIEMYNERERLRKQVARLQKAFKQAADIVTNDRAVTPYEFENPYEWQGLQPDDLEPPEAP